MEKNMQNYYSTMSELELRILRSKKHMRLLKVENEFGWFNSQETIKLRKQIQWIDTELACRAAQLKLL